ncbi:hypothetical protein HDU76_000855 [Blyttiomyces sp. JEL0837]|nr:hypothetical protein HDU76_000855 [Blyttiomyces sp. JEL0837]
MILQLNPLPGQCAVIVVHLVLPPGVGVDGVGEDGEVMVVKRSIRVRTERLKVFVDFGGVVPLERLEVAAGFESAEVKNVVEAGEVRIDADRDVDLESVNATKIHVQSQAGVIKAENIECANELKIKSSKDSIYVKNYQTRGSTIIETTSGNIDIANVQGNFKSIIAASITGVMSLSANMPEKLESSIEMIGETGKCKAFLTDFEGSFILRGSKSRGSQVYGKRLKYDVKDGMFVGTRGRGEMYHNLTVAEPAGDIRIEFLESMSSSSSSAHGGSSSAYQSGNNDNACSYQSDYSQPLRGALPQQQQQQLHYQQQQYLNDYQQQQQLRSSDSFFNRQPHGRDYGSRPASGAYSSYSSGNPAFLPQQQERQPLLPSVIVKPGASRKLFWVQRPIVSLILLFSALWLISIEMLDEEAENRYQYPPSKDLLPDWEFETPKRCADSNVPYPKYRIERHGVFQITVNKSAPPDSPLILKTHLHQSSPPTRYTSNSDPVPTDIPAYPLQPLRLTQIVYPEPAQCMMLMVELVVPPGVQVGIDNDDDEGGGDKGDDLEVRKIQISTTRMDVVVELGGVQTSVGDLEISTVLGDVVINGVVGGESILIESLEGDVTMNSVEMKKIDISAKAGNVSLRKVTSETSLLSSVPIGNVNAHDLRSTGEMAFDTISGNVNLDDVHGGFKKIAIRSITGIVTLGVDMPRQRNAMVDVWGEIGYCNLTLRNFDGNFSLTGYGKFSYYGSRIKIDSMTQTTLEGRRGTTYLYHNLIVHMNSDKSSVMFEGP